MSKEPKNIESYDNDSIKDIDIIRAVGLRRTTIPGLNQNFKYDSVPEPIPKSPHEILKIPDVRLSMHCYLIQYLILAKIFLTLVWIVGLGSLRALIFLPLLFLELIGYNGSVYLITGRIKSFIAVLGVILVGRLGFSGYFVSLIRMDECPPGKYYAFDSDCQFYLKFIVGSLFLVVIEVFQIALNVKLLKKIAKIGEEKRMEMSYVFISQKIPKFVCCGKIRAWKLASSK